MPKTTWTRTSPVNLLVNGGFDADDTYATGWTLDGATIALASGVCTITATASDGRIYQTLTNLRPDTEYRVGVTINGGASAVAGRLYTTGAAANFDQTFTTTDAADVGGVFRTDPSGSDVTVSLCVPGSGQSVAFDNAYVFTGNVQFAYSGCDLDRWRHPSDASAVDGGDLYPGSVAEEALPDQAANTVLAGPTSGTATTPSFRRVVAADLPYVFPDALLISHFDGPPPFNTDFSGNPNGHMGQPATLTGGVIFRPGKFGKALQVAEATTNLVHNPSAEGASEYESYHATVTREITPAPLYGSYHFKVVGTGDPPFLSLYTDNVTQGQTYTCSVWLRSPSGGTGTATFNIALYDVNTVVGQRLGATAIPQDDQWHRYMFTNTWAFANPGCRLLIYTNNGRTLHVDAAQVEIKAYATPYCDGSLGPGHSWSGTAHASASSRTAASIAYPTAGNFPGGDGTVAGWVKTNGIGYGTLVRMNCGGSTYAILRQTDLHVQAYWGAAGEAIVTGPPADGNWHHLAMTRSGSTVSAYLDGNFLAAANMSALGALPANLWVGSDGGTSEFANGLIDDLVILPRALSAAEVKALYDCGMPASAGDGNSLDATWLPSLNITNAVTAPTPLPAGRLSADTIMTNSVGKWQGYTYIGTSSSATIVTTLADGLYLLTAFGDDTNFYLAAWIRSRYGTGQVLSTMVSYLLSASFSGATLSLVNGDPNYSVYAHWAVTRFSA